MNYKLPTAPLPGMAEWLDAQGMAERQAIIFRRAKLTNPLTGEAEKCASCECTACGAQWYANIFGAGKYPAVEMVKGPKRTGDRATCPECGARVEMAYNVKLRHYPIREARYIWTIEKQGGTLAFINWHAERRIEEDGARWEIYPRNAYLIPKTGKPERYTTMERAGWSSIGPMVYTGEWYKMDRFAITDYCGATRFIYPHPADIWDGTALENAKMEKVASEITQELLTYAILYTKHQNIENLVMTCPGLVKAILAIYTDGAFDGRITRLDWIDWKAARPHEMLRMEKQEMRELDAKGDSMTWREAEGMMCRAYCKKWGENPETAQEMVMFRAEYVKRELHKTEQARRFGLARVLRYIKKQTRKRWEEANKKGGYRRERADPTEWLRSTARDCLDYWKDMAAAKFDVDDLAVVFPRSLPEAEARAVAAIQYETEEKLRAAFHTMGEKLAPLCWSSCGLTIRPAASEAELVAEGKILHHCVGGYGQDHCAGKSIFFIRRAEEPEIPYYTLQLDTRTGKVLQNRGSRNCARTEEVQRFEDEWLAAVVRPWMKQEEKRSRKQKKTEARAAACAAA